MTDKTTATMQAYPKEREYIRRLRNDPRLHAMLQGWVAQACMEAEQRGDPYDSPNKMAHNAAQRAVELALSFVLDNDGEYQAIREQLDRTLQASIDLANLAPRPFVMPAKVKP